MTYEFKKSLIIGSVMGLIFWLISYFEYFSILISLAMCVLFGPLTVWQIRKKPNSYALVISLTSGVFLIFSYGFKIGAIYTLGVLSVYGIMSVQFSIALENSYDNIRFIASKFKKRK
ncbi:hypothetical protein [Marinomonas mediterranea]|jgi:hypothetical protein|uniref:Uncharacterized protein n=1 Tax=Marinomonas mediterranea (strain ATCC 700492 / JCM 21426 / NBRC 103028 / MMB-1) TaxID=717774 RepID=F2JYG4_MARM1|nr:hypothetical protein [Marinomonas mediterranea]ADZ93093.1 hypothetical protein Marme_3883 [Marinomonas mediterranea MMB-1]WCN10996.1 hypothetical protein GV055_19690 [Marinomonas mediterranea]WCN15060.1 hypothetical protein GV054_19610 [Marinomonas mediterranea]WCN19104.1 hypothetical protein GV053_19670 [Marinomonas mediterranea MMB-1]